MSSKARKSRYFGIVSEIPRLSTPCQIDLVLAVRIERGHASYVVTTISRYTNNGVAKTRTPTVMARYFVRGSVAAACAGTAASKAATEVEASGGTSNENKLTKLVGAGPIVIWPWGIRE